MPGLIFHSRVYCLPAGRIFFRKFCLFGKNYIIFELVQLKEIKKLCVRLTVALLACIYWTKIFILREKVKLGVIYYFKKTENDSVNHADSNSYQGQIQVADIKPISRQCLTTVKSKFSSVIQASLGPRTVQSQDNRLWSLHPFSLG